MALVLGLEHVVERSNTGQFQVMNEANDQLRNRLILVLGASSQLVWQQKLKVAKVRILEGFLYTLCFLLRGRNYLEDHPS